MTLSVADKLIARSVIDGSCRRWTGSHNSRGYGLVCVGSGKSQLVHRVAYELWVGPIPDGYTIDHVAERGCRHKDCFEPAHLEAVTNAENIRRAPAATRDHCKRGHAYTAENLILKQRAVEWSGVAGPASTLAAAPTASRPSRRAPGPDRTDAQPIKSRQLCQLSYGGDGTGHYSATSP